MPIKIECSCGKKLSVKDEFAGRTVKCPVCQSRLSIPLTQDEVAAVAPQTELDFGLHDNDEPTDEGAGLLESIKASRREDHTKGLNGATTNARDLSSLRASQVRTGVSCYFCGFLLTFFASCYLAMVPSLHAGDFMAMGNAFRGVSFVVLLAKIITFSGLALCLTVPKSFPHSEVVFVGTFSALFRLLVAGAVMWSPLWMLRLGRLGQWLPLIVDVATELSFLLFLRWLAEFMKHEDLTRQATRVLKCYGLFYGATFVSLALLGAQIPMPLMLGRAGGGMFLIAVPVLIVWMASGIFGFFGLLRLLSNCRAALLKDGAPAVGR